MVAAAVAAAETRVVVVGAGLCGLSAAYHLEKAGHSGYVVLEAGSEVGGLARTETWDGFSFDLAIHILYSREAYATTLIRDTLLPGNLQVQERRSFCHTDGVYTEYPYQLHGFGLPPEVIADNILGLIEARDRQAQAATPANFREWIEGTFGRGIAERYMLPYNRKVWAWDLQEMSYDWIAGRVPVPDLRDVLLGALRAPQDRNGPNGEFWYPMVGGMAALPKALAAGVPQRRLRLQTRVALIDPVRRRVLLSDGESVPYDQLISTLPLPHLVAMLGDHAPAEVQAAAAGLHHNVVHTVSIGLDGDNLGLHEPMHWAYYPDERTVFHRLSFPHRFSRWMTPPGCASVQAEISESVYRPRSRSQLIQETLADLVAVGVLREGEERPVAQGGRVRVAQLTTLDPAYVIMTLAHRECRTLVRDYLRSQDILSEGRFGEWEYLNMDQSILRGREAARVVDRVRV